MGSSNSLIFQFYTTQMGHQGPAKGRFKVTQPASYQGWQNLSQVLAPSEPLLALDQAGGGTRSPTHPVLLSQHLLIQPWRSRAKNRAEEPSAPSPISWGPKAAHHRFAGKRLGDSRFRVRVQPKHL